MCAVLAVNNILTRHGHQPRHVDAFRAVAGGDCDASGHFEWLALSRALNMAVDGQRFGMTPVLQQEYLQPSPFTAGTLGFVLHTPGHWISLLPPPAGEDTPIAALLCDSLYTKPFGLQADELTALLRAIGDSQYAAALLPQVSEATRMNLAGRWSAYRVQPLSHANEPRG